MSARDYLAAGVMTSKRDQFGLIRVNRWTTAADRTSLLPSGPVRPNGLGRPWDLRKRCGVGTHLTNPESAGKRSLSIGGQEPAPALKDSAGDPIPLPCELIEVRVAELKQLFNAIDPSPFREKDLDGNAEEFIVNWAREAARERPLCLLVHLDRGAGSAEEPVILRDAVHEFFRNRTLQSKQRLRQLFRIGRISLMIGLAFLALSLGMSDLLATAMEGRRVGELLRESLLIGGWVAMWRPLEIFLYDWWPIRAEARLYERLSTMPVRIAYRGDPKSGSWRQDWPAVPPAETASR